MTSEEFLLEDSIVLDLRFDLSLVLADLRFELTKIASLRFDLTKFAG